MFNTGQKLHAFVSSKPIDPEVTKSGILYFVYSIMTFVSHVRIENVSA